MIDALAAIITGCFFGVFSGLAPGIHVNTIALAAGALAAKGDLNFALMVVSMTITHSFLDFIPSILLGAPDEENFLSALPGHRMLLQGKAFRAIKLTVAGGVLGTIISFAILPFYALFVIKTAGFLYKLIPALLLASMLLVVASEKTARQKIFAVAVVALSGALGLLALAGNYGSSGNTLFALVTGFFGTSTMVFSLKEKQSMKNQRLQKNLFKTISTIKASLVGTIASALVALFPAIGPSQAAFVVKKFSGKIGTQKYLVVLGCISAASSVFSFFVLYLLGKARTGTAVAIKSILVLQQGQMLQIVAAILIAVGFSVFLVDFVSRRAINEMQRFDYNKTNALVLAIMVLLVFFLAGAQGLLLLALSTSIGLIALSAKIKRTNCMAFLILPTVAYYLNQFLQ